MFNNIIKNSLLVLLLVMLATFTANAQVSWNKAKVGMTVDQVNEFFDVILLFDFYDYRLIKVNLTINQKINSHYAV